MKKIYLAFLWHQHQPMYKNPSTNVYELPWVRLHATKDYYDMVAILDDYPNIKSNFNLVPSLLVQLDEYAKGLAKDKFLELTLKSADELTNDEKVFILLNFFMANWDNMIFPYNRYLQLLEKRGRQTNEAEIRKTLNYFKVEDFRDLQVWFNLTWMDPYWRKTDEFIDGLYNKGRDFTEDEKNELVRKQLEICGKIVQKHKEAQDRGQIEVSITPFYHPILPLLCDTNAAHQATPNMALPAKRFSHTEDAVWQINKAVKYYEEVFGHKPKGMWPSEGSISNEAASLIADAGIKWTATDEAILFGAKDGVSDRRALFRPFNLRVGGSSLNMLFRDHGLSDSIGFVYSRWDSEDAVNDFINKIKNIGNFVGNSYDAPLISVILDGENCWEYYKNDGWDFLTKLYEKLSADNSIETVRISDYLEKFPPKNTITNLTAGSWINGNFGVWIGHPEDNASWDYLTMTRDFLTDFIEKNPALKDSQQEKEAWENLYAAEGSDWNWWYGDDHSSGNDAAFDYIYRQHLIKVYECIGQRPPDILYKSIKNAPKKYNVFKPTSFINPVIDGKVTSFFEWKNAGFYEVGHSGGSMHQVSTALKSFHYGFNMDNFYVRFDLSGDITMKSLEELTFYIIFLNPLKCKIAIKFSSEGNVVKFTLKTDFSEKALDVSNVSFSKIIEAAIPFKDLEFPQNYENVEFTVSVDKNDLEIERWPYQSTIVFAKPSEKFNFLSWTV
ncbi:MAG: glycoside hydrolase family 57 protein [Endomicrobia bacterium]|nr:glycoside hydrolase family 57 protein [Endomicrobiia bacterium]MCL2798967.1 glycoside hydrolase family 57 protein [Endomicrobiia bacterium]